MACALMCDIYFRYECDMASVVKSLFTKWVQDVIYALHEWDFPQTSAKVYKSVWRPWDVDEWDIPHAVDECAMSEQSQNQISKS
jgi:hypothetical protein